MGIKVDFRRTLKQFYNPVTKGFHLVDVPEMNFLMINGIGDPNTSSEYQQSVSALYSLSYGIKFLLKKQGLDYVVPPLEGLWWIENMNEFSLARKSQWQWTMMIMQPEWVSSEIVQRVTTDTKKKKSNPKLSNVKFELYKEGLAIQSLYTGAYANESPTIAAMHRFIKSNGYRLNGKHHEIYLKDPNKTSAEKLVTILRQPVVKT